MVGLFLIMQFLRVMLIFYTEVMSSFHEWNAASTLTWYPMLRFFILFIIFILQLLLRWQPLPIKILQFWNHVMFNFYLVTPVLLLNEWDDFTIWHGRAVESGPPILTFWTPSVLNMEVNLDWHLEGCHVGWLSCRWSHYLFFF